MTGLFAASEGDAGALVRRLWQYCNVLRDDGLSYPDYVEQLTYLLFLKMSEEQVDSPVPLEWGWESFAHLGPVEMHVQYGKALSALGECQGMLGLIFKNAKNKIRDPAKLRLLVNELIGQTMWTRLSNDLKGDAYEGLLEKNARDTKSGAGQYFTPRALIDAIVQCIDPQLGEVIADPACGTGGFLLAAHKHIRDGNPEIDARASEHLRTRAMRGVELVEEVARLATMNLLLHGIGGDEERELPIACKDSLRDSPSEQVDVVLTNPPFGVKGTVTYVGSDGRQTRSSDELTIIRPDFWVQTSNKQLNFLQHIVAMLKPGGRAAVVLPDNTLFEAGAAAAIRRRLLEICSVHTILRLPPGLFYAHGVKSNVLFFDKVRPDGSRTGRSIWLYDLRSDNRFSLKANPLKPSDLHEFVDLFRAGTRGEDPARPRWQAFSLDDVLATDDCRLDLARADDLSRIIQPASRLDEISELIASDLRDALIHLSRVTAGGEAE